MPVNKVVAVVGAGPGLGAALARRFAREGFTVALLARSPATLAPIQAEVTATGVKTLGLPMDCADAKQVADAFARIRQELGAVGVLAYNAGSFVMAGIQELQPAQLEAAWQVSCLGALLCAQQVLPAMVAAKAGTILLTGATASLRGSARFAGLAVGKFGLRALGQSMAREFGPQGIHVAHVVVDGQIATPRARTTGRAPHTLLDPDGIAESYWQLHVQHPTAWTQELDVRPAVEKF